LPILHSVQAEYGFIPSDVIEYCSRLNITRAEVHGVISFSQDFSRSIRTGMSRFAASLRRYQAVGSGAVTTRAKSSALDWGDTTTRRTGLTIEAVLLPWPVGL
jgi:formate dehydrogenase subunit gamma